LSSQSISGQYRTPIYNGGRPTASVSNCGQIIRTSGMGTNKTYIWISVRKSDGNYEWVQLGISN
jgi:hypothetical protein